MDNRSFLICILVVIVVAAAIYFVSGHTTDHYQCGPDLIDEPLPTCPEVEYIEGHPDMHAVNHDGVEIIPHGDIAMSPALGGSEGLVGFGRYASSFMV
jgi:hypothetical protein